VAETPQSGKEQAAELGDRAECPACGSLDVDSSISGLNPFCTDCGAVVTAPVEFDVASDEYDSEDGSSESWSDHCRVTNSTESQIAQALEILEELGAELDLSVDTRERAAQIYADGAIEDLTDGRSTDTFVTACLSVAGDECRSPIPASHIAEVAGVDSDSLRRISRILREELNYGTTPCPPRSYLGHLSQSLDLDEPIITVANEILESVPACRISGKHPGAFAGAALYIAADGQVTQRDIAMESGVTTETIRLRVNECREAIDSQAKSRQILRYGDQ